MPESESNKSQKELAFYSAAVDAWVATRFELDRQLLTLSVAGIGVLVTLLTTAGACGLLQGILYAIALGGFLLCTVTVLVIFRLNSTYLESIAQDETASGRTLLRGLDIFASGLFGVAILAAIGVGVAKAISVPT